jgi:hypothetical protein
MWFKTREGFILILEPLEIRVAKYPENNPPHYAVYARSLKDLDFRYEGGFGKATASGISRYVAKFPIADASEAAITHCMALIEEAIRGNAQMCDLSMIGEEASWGETTYLVHWNRHTH